MSGEEVTLTAHDSVGRYAAVLNVAGEEVTLDLATAQQHAAALLETVEIAGAATNLVQCAPDAQAASDAVDAMLSGLDGPKHTPAAGRFAVVLHGFAIGDEAPQVLRACVGVATRDGEPLARLEPSEAASIAMLTLSAAVRAEVAQRLFDYLASDPEPLDAHDAHDIVLQLVEPPQSQTFGGAPQ